MAFRETIRDAVASVAYNTYRTLGSTCSYTDRAAVAVTLQCWAGAVSEELAMILGCRSEEAARGFDIPKQTGFDETNVHIDNVIEFEGHKWHVRRTNNEDGVGAIFHFDAVCSHPLKAGSVA